MIRLLLLIAGASVFHGLHTFSDSHREVVGMGWSYLGESLRDGAARGPNNPIIQSSISHTTFAQFLHLLMLLCSFPDAVLGLSALLEGYSLWVATRHVIAGAAVRKMPVLSYIKSGTDPTTVAVMLEDGGALLGLIIAGMQNLGWERGGRPVGFLPGAPTAFA